MPKQSFQYKTNVFLSFSLFQMSDNLSVQEYRQWGIAMGAVMDTPKLVKAILNDIRRWWVGEITGERCVKNVIDNGVTVAAGLGGGSGGGTLGATVGTAISPGFGTVVGAVLGAVVGAFFASITAQTLCEMLTAWAFGLPQTEALENAYNFLGVSYTASINEINSRYRHLCLAYHPDKGGDPEKWVRLQYSMAIIREARQ